MNEVLVGAGLATGHFYHAPAGTPLPEHPFATLDKAWAKVGDITVDGVTITTDKSTDNLKNWANKIKRTILTDHTESVDAPVMDTTEATMKTLFGEENVKITEATSEHGKLIDVHLSADDLPEPEAFLFIVKDGEAGAMLGCTKGQITALADIALTPTTGVTYDATITGQDDGFHYVIDDGEKVVSG